MGQLTVGPIDQNLLRPVNQSLALMLCNPAVPVSENFGNRSAVVAPICAVAAASCLSAVRTSGRRLRSSEGNPTRTSGGRLGIAPAFDSSSQRARSEEHTSELQSRLHLVCRLLLE